jgi:hypothetical protein
LDIAQVLILGGLGVIVLGGAVFFGLIPAATASTSYPASLTAYSASNVAIIGPIAPASASTAQPILFPNLCGSGTLSNLSPVLYISGATYTSYLANGYNGQFVSYFLDSLGVKYSSFALISSSTGLLYFGLVGYAYLPYFYSLPPCTTTTISTSSTSTSSTTTSTGTQPPPSFSFGQTVGTILIIPGGFTVGIGLVLAKKEGDR